MKISDLFLETTSAITVNKIRSGLTILGIVIGIGSVIAMVSIGQGAQMQIENSIQSIGSNLIIVQPGFQRGTNPVSAGRGTATSLTQADADAIQNGTSLAQAVAPELTRRHQVTARGTNTNTNIDGTVASYLSVRNAEVDQGFFISDQDLSSLSKVAVLGPTTALDLFGEDDPLGQNVRINRIDFKVIGVMKSRGGSGFGSQDDVIYIPLTTAQRFLAGATNVSTISVQAVDQNSMTDLQLAITDILLERHNLSDATQADFQVMNQQEIVAAASSVTNTLTALLASIAGISLLVGGIGIMNMMLTNVTERTREIGLRKAIGAKRSEISLQFLSESVMLTFLGGFFGICLGWLLSLAVNRFAGMATSISWPAIALAFGVSATIGIVFGYYPARKAAALNPIVALRYE
ncbi:MAG: ABC transporter permease [bacterium]